MSRSHRTYSELSGRDRSGLEGQISAQGERVARRLDSVSRIVGVMSGKGGVGKSFVTASLAASFSSDGARVGLLDADLHGATAARMSGAKPRPLSVEEGAVAPVAAEAGVVVMSMELLLEAGAPLVWRGPEADSFVWEGAEERRALREFLSDVAWGAQDWLFVDLPPGTRAMVDLHELVPRLTGVVAVTLPAEAASASVDRALTRARQRGIPVLGVIENMSGYACPACGSTLPLFPGEGGTKLVVEHGTRLLGRVPFDPAAAAMADRGDVRGLLADTASGGAIREIAHRIAVATDVP